MTNATAAQSIASQNTAGGGQCLSDHNGSAFQVLHHFDRLKTNSAEAFAAEYFISKGIVLRLAFSPVLASIHFYDQAM